MRIDGDEDLPQATGSFDGSGFDRRTVLGGGFAVALGAATMTRAMASPSPTTAEAPGLFREAVTTSGRIMGLDHGPVLAFRGVPYGASTGGANRFKPPQPVKPWSGVRECIGHGSASPQAPVDPRYDFANLLQFNTASSIGGMGEDCLNLNVWTPSLGSDSGRPVLVSFHGGGFNNGSSNVPLYDGAHLAAQHDVVVVTVNHRLNALGYVDLAGAGAPAEFGGAGVAGLLDLVAALRWVRDNAKSFGGDPSLVTIFGQSGGGWKTSCLLAMPSARGLFRRAVVQSGSLLRVKSREDGAKLATKLLQELGVRPEKARDLQHLPWSAYEQAAAKVGLPLFEPVLNETHLPRHPFDPSAPVEMRDVPVMIGTTLDDASFLYPDPALDEEGMRNAVKQRFGSNSDAILALYRRRLPKLTPFLLLGRIVTDAGFRRFAHAQSERIALAGQKVFAYQWNWTTPAFEGRFGAAHAGDVPATFYNTEQSLVGAGSATGMDLATRMSDAIVSFARSGAPSADPAAWPAYDATNRATMVFDIKSLVVSDPDAELRRFWDGIPMAATVFGV